MNHSSEPYLRLVETRISAPCLRFCFVFPTIHNLDLMYFQVYKIVLSISTLPLIFVYLFRCSRICFSPFIYSCNHLRLEIAVQAPGSENVRNFANHWRSGRATHAQSPKAFAKLPHVIFPPPRNFRRKNK